jgi:hypothetical protein
MQLRWSAAIALWTILSGPVLNNHGTFTAPSREPSRPVVKKHINRQDAKTAEKDSWRSSRLGG